MYIIINNMKIGHKDGHKIKLFICLLCHILSDYA